MSHKPDYLRAALALPAHKLLLVVGAVAAAAGLWRGHLWPLALFALAELAFVLVLPALPAFRAFVDRGAAEEAAHQKAVDLERVALKLSPNARSRLDGVQRTCARIMDALKAMDAPASMERAWGAQLGELSGAALRILVAIDQTRVEGRDERFLAAQIEELQGELARAGDGPAKAAKEQRLEVLKRRAGGAGPLREQREAAVTQFETLEDLLKELLDQAVAGRDASAFGRQLQALQARAEALGETVAALDRRRESAAELALLKADEG